MKKHNFNPGPSILSQFTLEKTAEAILDLDGIGISVMSISHRSKEFTSIIQDAKSHINELLDVPDGYSILFLGGGASLQFSMIPYNLLNRKAAYLNTGSWASKAIKEAGIFGEVVIVASSEDKNFNYIPTGYTVPPESDYFHITTNNTIYGTEIKSDLDSPVPLVADMSSDIFSRPVDVSKYGLIYAGAQKNLGPAGVTLVIVRDDILGCFERAIPSMLNYKLHIEKESMYNTPPVLTIYASLQTLIWLKNQGGLPAMHKTNVDKAKLLYDEIERNRLFKCTVGNHDDKSIMNVCFVMHEEYNELENPFIEFVSSKGITGIKGHRSVGGFRASLYNALSRDSVLALIEAMKEFEKSV